MEIKDNMYYGFGQVIYALAIADGKLQKEEQDKLKFEIEKISASYDLDMSITLIIFKQLEKHSDFNRQNILQEGIKNFHLGDDYLTSEIASFMREVMLKVAESVPPITNEEEEIIETFLNYLQKREIAATKQTPKK